MSVRIPIPFPHIKDKDDHQVVKWLLDYVDWATSEFLYGRCYPLFKSLHDRYYTNCPELYDFIHDIYIDVIQPRKQCEKCKLASFQFKSTLYTWMGVVSIRFCYAKYKVSINVIPISDGNDEPKGTVADVGLMNLFDHSDLEKVLNAMPNDRYREIIRLRYLSDLSNGEAANRLNMGTANFNNKLRLAKAQFVCALKKEGLL